MFSELYSDVHFRSANIVVLTVHSGECLHNFLKMKANTSERDRYDHTDSINWAQTNRSSMDTSQNMHF